MFHKSFLQILFFLFWSVVLKKDGEDQLDRSCEKQKKYYLRVKEQRNILHEISKGKANWIGHILRRNCLLQRFIEGKIKGGIEVAGRWGRRRRKLLDDLKERRGYSYLREEALDRTMWRARFGRGFGPVVRQTTKWMKNMRFTNSLLTCTVAQMRKSSTSTKLKEYSALSLL